MKLKRIIGIGLLLACMLVFTACSQDQKSASSGSAASSESAKSTTSEGVDTPIKVTYTGHPSSMDSLFLKEGDTVAVISPSALPKQEQVDATVEGLKKWGYNPVLGKHVAEKDRTLDDCVEDLKWALEDSDVKAIFCVRGGYGVSEVLDALPQGLIAKSKKLIIGYSDITVCHSAWTASKVPSIHACMSAAFGDFPAACAEAEQKILRGEIPSYTCEGSEYDRKGEAEGVLIGGNLSTFTSVLGTAYDCTKMDEPYILFLEDVEEDVQHVHRYLTILKHLGVLDKAAGIVFGEWTDVPKDMADYDGGSRGGEFKSMADMISRQILGDSKIPVAFGFPAGHGDNNYPLLMGAKAHLNVSDGSYTLNWSDK